VIGGIIYVIWHIHVAPNIWNGKEKSFFFLFNWRYWGKSHRKSIKITRSPVDILTVYFSSACPLHQTARSLWQCVEQFAANQATALGGRKPRNSPTSCRVPVIHWHSCTT
jgi:hypothetical protein